jgi:hypothetical protein
MLPPTLRLLRPSFRAFASFFLERVVALRGRRPQFAAIRLDDALKGEAR